MGIGVDTGFLTRIMIQNAVTILSANQGVILDAVTDVLDGVEGLGEDLELDILSQVEGALGDALDEDGAILGKVEDTLDNFLATAEDDLGGIVGGLQDILEKEIGEGTGLIADAAESVIGAIGDESTGALDVLKDIGGSILEDIGISTDSALDTVTSTADAILRIIGVDARGAIEAVRRVADQVDETTTGILNVVAGNVSDAFDSIDLSVARETEAATRALETTSEVVAQQSEQQLEASEQQAEAIRQGIDESLAALTDTSEGALSEVAESTDAQTRATAEQTGVIQAGMGGITDGLQAIAGKVGGFIPGMPELGEFLSGEAALKNLREGLIATGMPEENADELVSIFANQLEGTPGPVLSFTVLIMHLMFTRTLLDETTRVAINPILQRIARANPSALPGVAEILEMRNRNLLDDPLAIEMMRLQGYSESLANGLLNVRHQLPEVGVVQSWFLRGFITRDVASSKFQSLGFDDGDTERLIDMSFYIPPPQDIILWAVREVFNVAQAQRFGQFDEFPNEFADLAEKQGISREFAQNYWAAHWRMPSLTRLFEMYHRKIIDRETLELTIKSHDYTPFWRDPLIDVAYKPLTRVDVRRMHDLGLITEDELQSRYEDLGFSPADARMMTEFTVEFNAEPAAESPEVIEEVARRPILSLYNDGVILADEALERLTELGMPESEARIFIEAENLERERQDRKAQKELVIEQAKAGALTFDEAYDRLSGLGFEPEELNRAVTEIHRARAMATKLPTRDELDKMLARNLITDSEYVEALQRIGYAPFWAQRFLRLQTENPQ